MTKKEKDHLYYLANADRIKAQVKAWRARNASTYKEKYMRWLKGWKANNPDKVASAKLKHRYGITLQERNTMEAEQGGVCAICETPPNGKPLSIDHDHETGNVRKLLCFHCNAALGHMGDQPGRLRKAADYLENHAC